MNVDSDGVKVMLAHYELAARKYCERLGVNPEEVILVPHDTIAGATMRVRQWHLAAEKLHDLSMMLTSLRDAATEKEKLGIILPATGLNS